MFQKGERGEVHTAQEMCVQEQAAAAAAPLPIAAETAITDGMTK